MFPRAKRFTDKVPASDVPGPGAYNVDVKSPDRPWKKGALALEKQERFHDTGIEPPDTFGLYDPVLKENTRPRPSSSLAPERARLQMEDMKHRLQNAHEREVVKLQSRLAKAEQARLDAVQEKTELKASLATLKGTNTSLESQLAKHTSTLPLLQSKLDALVQSHAASHARKDATLTAARVALSHSAELVARSRQEALSDRRERIAERGAEAIERVQWEKKVREKDALIDALREYAEAGDEQLDLLGEELDDVRTELRWVREELLWERAARLGEKDWRQRCRSEARELAGKEEELKFEREVREACEVRDRIWRDEDARVKGELGATLATLQDELEVAEGELDLALNEEIPRLETSQDEATDRISELEDELTSANDELTAARNEQNSLRGELEEARRRLRDSEKEVERERQDKKRIAGLLGQSRAGEAGLKEELEAAMSELAHFRSAEFEHAELRQRVDELARRNALAESDVQQLGALNTDLLSHQNAGQRIRHVAAIRSDLALSRQAHLTTTSQLAMSQRENEALRAELDSYRAVSNFPTASGRSRVVRPNLDDVPVSPNPYDEENENAMPPPPIPVTAPGRAGLKQGLEISIAPNSLLRSVRFAGGEGDSRALRMSGKMSVSELFG